MSYLCIYSVSFLQHKFMNSSFDLLMQIEMGILYLCMYAEHKCTVVAILTTTNIKFFLVCFDLDQDASSSAHLLMTANVSIRWCDCKTCQGAVLYIIRSNTPYKQLPVLVRTEYCSARFETYRDIYGIDKTAMYYSV